MKIKIVKLHIYCKKWLGPRIFSGYYQKKGKSSAMSIPSSLCFSKAYLTEFVVIKIWRYVYAASLHFTTDMQVLSYRPKIL